MTLRLIGAALVVCGCGAMGFSVANGYRREERALQMLIRALEYMISQLRYQHSALPELCRGAAESCTGTVRSVLEDLAGQLSAQICADAGSCLASVVASYEKLPETVKRNLLLLGQTLGRFDAAGQLSGLESVKELASRDLSGLRSGLEEKLRACRTLGLCAGAALAILLI